MNVKTWAVVGLKVKQLSLASQSNIRTCQGYNLLAIVLLTFPSTRPSVVASQCHSIVTAGCHRTAGCSLVLQGRSVPKS